MKIINTKAVIIGKATMVWHYENDKFSVITTNSLFTYTTDEISEIYNYGPIDIFELKQTMFNIQSKRKLVQ